METDLHKIRNREEMIRFFDGYAIERMGELDEQGLRRPLVKSQLVELLDQDATGAWAEPQSILHRSGVRLNQIDDALFLVTDIQNGPIGFLEQLRPRILAIYSTIKTDELVAWVRSLILNNPHIDYVWLSGLTFNVLWQVVAQLSRPHRFTKLVFTHDSIFEIDALKPDTEEEEDETPDGARDEDVEEIVERRATSFRLVDRIGIIQDKLRALQSLYSPLYAVSQLRFPSPVGHGGHDFYDNGRVTNRSGSFRDHRSHLLFVVRIYERLLKSTEEQAWYSIQDSIGKPGEFRKIVGAPVTVRFQEPGLEPEVFDNWIAATFRRKRNRFRLWGHPVQLGKSKVHVYGVDRHLWQPLFLELTTKGLTAIIPNGTCGNTVHRLVTNIQRFLDPGAQAYIGEKPYKDMVEEAARGIPYDLDSQ